MINNLTFSLTISLLCCPCLFAEAKKEVKQLPKLEQEKLYTSANEVTFDIILTVMKVAEKINDTKNIDEATNLEPWINQQIKHINKLGNLLKTHNKPNEEQIKKVGIERKKMKALLTKLRKKIRALKDIDIPLSEKLNSTRKTFFKSLKNVKKTLMNYYPRNRIQVP